MGVLNKGTNYQDGDQVTSGNLNAHVDDATFTSAAVDNASTQLSGGAIIVKDGGITTQKLADGAVTASKLAGGLIENLYPVGSVYMNATDGTNPDTLLGFGTWVAFGAGRVPVGFDALDSDFDAAEKEGGEKEHTLTEAEMAAHTHFVAKDGVVPESGNITAATSVADVATQGGSTFQSYHLRPGINVNADVGLSSTTGGDLPHNNLQPYITVYMWKRTA